MPFKLPVFEICKQLRFALFLVMALFCKGNITIAQNSKIELLKQDVKAKSDTIVYNALISLAVEYAGLPNNPEAIRYAEDASKLAYRIGDSAKIVRSNRVLAQLLNRVESKDAIDVTLKVIETAKRNKLRNDYKILLNGLAFAYTIQAEYDKALEIHLKSLILREEDGDKSEISIALNNIGLVYFKMKNYERALDYYNRSLELKNQIKDKHDLGPLLINIGLSNVHIQHYQKALEYINLGLSECKHNCNQQLIIGKFGLGVANFGLRKFDEAAAYFTESLNISLTENNIRFQAENYVYLAKIAIIKEENESAKELLNKAESVAIESSYNQLLIDTYRQFSNLYNQTNDFQNASLYQNKYIKLKDSLIGEELVKNISRIQSNFEERDNLNTIRLKEEALVRQRNLNIAIGVIAVLAGLLVFVLYKGYTTTRKVNTQLSEAKGIITIQNQRLQNINRELDAKVKEKTAELVKTNEELDKTNKTLSQVNDELDNFIYKTSHDIRGPLASLKGICSVALMDVQDPLALDYLTKLDISSGRLNVILTRLLIVNQINHAILNYELIEFTSMVDDILLLERKKGLPDRIKIRKDIHSDLVFHSDKDLFKIILENLIDNSIKFYNDSERIQPFVNIKIAPHGSHELIVSVVDNGIGISEAKPDKIFQMFSRASERSGTGGIGLYLCKLATEKLGGQINLRNTPEGHTEFYAIFPLRMA